jgi:hypothetical protein
MLLETNLKKLVLRQLQRICAVGRNLVRALLKQLLLGLKGLLLRQLDVGKLLLPLCPNCALSEKNVMRLLMLLRQLDVGKLLLPLCPNCALSEKNVMRLLLLCPNCALSEKNVMRLLLLVRRK